MTTPQWTVDDEGDLVFEPAPAWLFKGDAPYDVPPIAWPEAFAALVADVAAARLVEKGAAWCVDCNAIHLPDGNCPVVMLGSKHDPAAARLVDDMAAERDQARIDLEEALRKAQRPGSVLAQQHCDGTWMWLWQTEGGGIGHEEASPGEVTALHHARQQERTT